MMELQLAGIGIYEHTLVNLLGMKTPLLLGKDQDGSCTCNTRHNDEPCDESKQKVDDDEPDYCTAYGSCSPEDVASLQSHELQRSLQPLEDREIGKGVFYALFFH